MGTKKIEQKKKRKKRKKSGLRGQGSEFERGELSMRRARAPLLFKYWLP